MTNTPDLILFAQHGWADNTRAIAALSRNLATSKTYIVAPDLGFIETWIKIKPLIQKVEQIVLNTIAKYPNTPIKIIGHSMGGLIWIELLNQYPEWWSSVESLVLIASPIGGADLGRIIDPLGLGIGMARDLSINRRQMAQTIAQMIPTLVIAGDTDGGSDGTITVESTKFEHAKFVCLPSLSHSVLKNHLIVAATIRNFWVNLTEKNTNNTEIEIIAILIQRLQLVTGITEAHRRDFYRSNVYIMFKNGITIRTWKNPLQVAHVFVANSEGQCLYAGFVGWIHAEDLRKAFENIKSEYYHNINI